MWGSLPTLNSAPFAAFNRTANVAGTGAAPEGIDQNLDSRLKVQICSFLVWHWNVLHYIYIY